tara:strand:+ start:748 stop:1140 length:393 start_codon:yes stop_codon:yes gene_type:complete
MLKRINNMNFLIIDAASDTVCFFSYYNNQSYSKSFLSSKINFEKIVTILFQFLKNNNIHLEKINNILVNQGPGRFSSLRISIAITKALSLSNNIDFYGFNTKDLKDNNYENIIKLYNKGKLTKNLIKTTY